MNIGIEFFFREGRNRTCFFCIFAAVFRVVIFIQNCLKMTNNNVKYVYTFGGKKAEGKADMKNLLGGKGANLAEMCLLGLPVPAGLTITTECCTAYYANNCQLPEGLMDEVWAGMKNVESLMGMKYDDPENPLLVSCRSGARTSMPGMMDTVLNIGLSTKTIPGLIKKTNNPRFVYDSYRRLIMMYADVVMEKAEGIEPKNDGIRKMLDDRLDQFKASKGYQSDTEITADELKQLAEEFKAIVKAELGTEFPDDAKAQLEGGIKAVFKSWDGKKAVSYRRIEGIPDDWGTAVNVQAMVFGNMGDNSATGVAFTRDPATGDNKFYGEWLINAQGEDVVAGIRTPNPLNNDTKNDQNKHLHSMEELMPDTYKELFEIRNILENHYKDMLDIEFTIQDGKLYMLQCRVGKRTGRAAVKMALDMLHDGWIDEKTAVLRVPADKVIELILPILDPTVEKLHKAIAKGLPAGPGGSVGKIALTSEKAMEYKAKKIANILVREETNPEDVEGMRAANGILTARGGMTSHAALVARGWGKSCIVGCSAVEINFDKKEVTIGGHTFHEGDTISLNGTLGAVHSVEMPLIIPEIEKDPLFQEFMGIVDKYRKMGVRTNADTPKDAANAVRFGAEGIGLFRIEHMFYGEDGKEPLVKLRNMILANTTEERKAALNELEPYIREAAKGTLKVMDGKPLTFRLMDPPLHEFVPSEEDKQIELAKERGMELSELKTRIEALHEINPMMGLRGVRLGIVYPEITETQFRALFQATAELMKEGNDPHLEIMVPLTINVKELQHQKAIADRVKKEVEAEFGVEINYLYGTMIEIPRATLVADKIATVAQFFSFGTNDLTQMTFGFSRDDVNKIVKTYTEEGIIPADPFNTLDQEGVGQLVEKGVKLGRSTRENLKCGVCGEHGGDPASVEFFYKTGLNYVSCSPFRVPVARVAAAQAAIKAGK